ncbi:MAG: perosamine synthetase [Planctomycetota bacterium]|nr:MAG: perosamine synthetase [Planctomycetota bacterium]
MTLRSSVISPLTVLRPLMPTDSPALLGGVPVRPAGPPVWPRRTPETDAVLLALSESGDWGRYHGPHTGILIAALSQDLQRDHVQLCASGTAAVELALRGLSVGPGDEVILSAYDFKANFTNVVLLGAVPVLIDCRADDAQLEVSAVEAACTDKTRAIIASHLQGGLVDMPALREIADRRGVALIEDVCQSPGAVIAGRPAGAWGDVATLSFGGSKLVTAGRGGAVLTSRPEIAQRIKLYHQRGNEAYPLSEMQAALLLPQWKQLKHDHATRTKAVLEISSQLAREQQTSPPLAPLCRSHLTTDRATNQNAPAFYKLGFWYDNAGLEGLPRERFCRAMRAEGIAIDPGFAGLHLIHARSRFRAGGPLTHATQACSRIVMLHHPLLLESQTAARDFQSALDKITHHARMLIDTALPSDTTQD